MEGVAGRGGVAWSRLVAWVAGVLAGLFLVMVGLSLVVRPSSAPAPLSARPVQVRGSQAATTAAAAQAGPGAPAATAGSASGAAPATGAQPEAAAAEAPVDLAERKVVRQVSLALAVADVGQAFARVGQLAQAQGGYVESSTLSDAATLTVRVPSGSLQGFLAAVRQLGEVTSESQSGRDVTQQMIDLDARIRALRSEAAAYEQLYARTGDIGQVLQIQKALGDVQAQIDSLTQEQRSLDRMATLATVQITLAARGARPSDAPAGVGAILAPVLGALLASLQALFVLVAYVLPWAALAAVAAGVVLAVRHSRARLG